MAPRRSDRNGRRQGSAQNRPPGLGSHWRADGNPKTGYRTQGDALAAADARREESGADLNVYRCDVCSAWHMGNARGRDA